jgi:membrane-bound metal-dependent hydrolase YbcI (DUF457 family)
MVMPFTPFHLGPALFFGLLLFRYINLPTFLIASVIVDIEPFLVLFLGLDYPLHGFLHSFLGGSIVAVVLLLVIIKLNNKTQELMSFLKLGQSSSTRSIWLASFSSIYLHILFDSPLYTDIKPFYPFNHNPFYNGMLVEFEIRTICVLMFFAGSLIYGYKLIKNKRKVLISPNSTDNSG